MHINTHINIYIYIYIYMLVCVYIFIYIHRKEGVEIEFIRSEIRKKSPAT